MKNNIERAKEQVPAVILTLLSMVQALALEFFWSKANASEFLWLGGWTAVVGWLQFAVVLEGILLIWILYVNFVLRFTWLPTLEDTLLPFVIGLLEFALIDKTEPATVGPWMMLLSLVFALALLSAHTTMRRAESEPDNAYFFSQIDRGRGWRSYTHSMSSIALLMGFGLALWIIGPILWLTLTALLVAFVAFLYQYMQSRQYWLHSLTPTADEEP